MIRQSHIMLAIYLALLLVLGRMPLGHAAHDWDSSFQHPHCERRSGVPAPLDRDCTDICLVCQISLKDIVSPPPPLALGRAARNGTKIRIAIVAITFEPQPVGGGNYARAPPALF